MRGNVNRRLLVLSAACVLCLPVASQEGRSAFVVESRILSDSLGRSEARELLAQRYGASAPDLKEVLSAALAEQPAAGTPAEQVRLVRAMIRRQVGIERIMGVDTSSNPLQKLPDIARDGTELRLASGIQDFVSLGARSVALLAGSDAVSNGAAAYPLRVTNMAGADGLCAAELEPYPFRDEVRVLSALRCTASLVELPGESPALLTARHCVPQYPRVEGLVAVFDYVLGPNDQHQPGSPVVVALSGAVVKGATTYLGRGGPDDWALLPLPADFALDGRAPFKWLEGAVEPDEPIYTLHHPLGLPLKFTPDGRQQGRNGAGQIRAAIDAFGGSSGAPVFVREGELVGIVQASGSLPDFLVRGAPCNQIVRCSWLEVLDGCAPILVGRLSPTRLAAQAGS